MIDNTPWAVGGGAEHSPEVARLLAYASTSGAEGVVEPASLRVSAQSTPNGTVRVLPGAALIRNRYAGGGQQTYVLRNATSTNVTIPATGSGGGRTDAIIARVLDPQYEGAAPPDPVSFQYSRLERIGSVPGNLTRIEQLGLSYPAILLAKVTIPASTGTITSGMITDLREVAIPRSKRRVYPVRISKEGVEDLSAVVGEYWPNEGGVQFLDIPEWATHMNVVCTWAQVLIPANSNPYGLLTMRFGPWDGTRNKYETQYVSFDALAGDNKQRTTFTLPVNRTVPADIRGTNQPFVLFGVNQSNSPSGKRAMLDVGSAVSMDIEFLEVAGS